MRLIDADELSKKFERGWPRCEKSETEPKRLVYACDGFERMYSGDFVLDCINQAPTEESFREESARLENDCYYMSKACEEMHNLFTNIKHRFEVVREWLKKQERKRSQEDAMDRYRKYVFSADINDNDLAKLAKTAFSEEIIRANQAEALLRYVIGDADEEQHL